MISDAARTDSELVDRSLSGDGNAFEQIVARYQSLVCSLAYSATGSLSQSEDLAQETFVTAWKQLAGLREREKLRSWLCGISRNLINNWLRKEGREPSHHAESLEEAAESCSSAQLPAEQVISREEEAILWRSLEHIPEIYREPLILYYREHDSIETVAANLGLTEDAVKQRLSRGRKLLQEQVLAFVEGTLRRTSPSKAFTLGVLAALPLAATTAKAAVAGTATAKGGAVAKATGLVAFLQVILKLIVPAGVFMSLGGWLGYKMGGDMGQPPKRDSVIRFWGILLAGIVAFVLLPISLGSPLMRLFGGKENLLTVMKIWLDVMYVLILGALVLWLRQRRKAASPENVEVPKKQNSLFVWLVALAMIFSAAFVVLGLSDSNWKVENVNSARAREIIEQKSENAEFFILRFHNRSAFKVYSDTYDELWIKLEENGHLLKFTAPADSATLALLSQKGIECPTYVQGRDFEILGWQGKLFLGLCLFVFAAGTAVLLTLSFKNKSKSPIMTKGTQIGIVAAIILAALIVTPLVVLNHRKVNTIHSNYRMQSLTADQSAQAKQTAQNFFEALGKGDWDKISKLCPPGYSLGDEIDAQTKDKLEGLELLSLGEPYKKPSYAGVFVPYEIRFKSGDVKKFNLAVRNDNPEQKWYFDGGF